MWYQLYIDYEKMDYKISKVNKVFESTIKQLEEQEQKEPSISLEAIYYNRNYYFSKNKNALKRKLEELGRLYYDEMDEIIRENKRVIHSLESELESLKRNVELKREKQINLLKKFSNHVGDRKEYLKVNISKVKVAEKGFERIKKTLEPLGIVFDYDVLNYCQNTILNPNTYVYLQNKNWIIENDEVKLTIHPNTLTIITVHLKHRKD